MPVENGESPNESAPKSSESKTKGNKILPVAAVALVVLVALAGTGYFVQKQLAENAIEKVTEGNAEVSKNGKEVSVETKDGNLTVGKDEVPKSFPKDLTVYKNSKVAATSETTNSVSVILKTNDSADTAFSFYKADLNKNGWTTTESSSSTGISVLNAKKASKSAIITVSGDPDNKYKTMITISVQTNS